jgi:YidC/Oxa1 family membrane protein insertase
VPDSFTQIWNTLLVWPIEGALLALVSFTTSAGWAIILFTVIIRTVMLPLSLAQIKSQKAMMALQPRLRELQQRYAGDRNRMGQEQIRLYKEAGVNPVAGCLPMLLQLPIWFALYSALINLSNRSVDPNAEEAVKAFSHGFLWIPNLAALSAPTTDPVTWPLVILPVLTAITQWIVQKMSTMPTTDPQQQQMNRMMELMPFMFLMFSFQVAAGLTLYWVVSNLYTIVQQYFAVGWGTLPYLGSGNPPASGGGSPAALSGRGPNGQGPNGRAVTPPRPHSSPTRRRSPANRRRRGR